VKKTALLLFTITACHPTRIAECPLADETRLMADPAGFYRCADGILNKGDGCGEDGYLLGYAAKYAERYMWETYPQLSLDAQGFLERNLLCLQTVFRDTVQADWACDSVAEFAFKSHADCYLNSGICDLDLSDRLAILMAVDAEDLNQPGQDEAFSAIAEGCEEFNSGARTKK
jgi:hypothetical protein